MFNDFKRLICYSLQWPGRIWRRKQVLWEQMIKLCRNIVICKIPFPFCTFCSYNEPYLLVFWLLCRPHTRHLDFGLGQWLALANGISLSVVQGESWWTLARDRSSRNSSSCSPAPHHKEAQDRPLSGERPCGKTLKDESQLRHSCLSGAPSSMQPWSDISYALSCLPAEPCQPTDLWNVIILRYLKPFNLGWLVYVTINNGSMVSFLPSFRAHGQAKWKHCLVYLQKHLGSQ